MGNVEDEVVVRKLRRSGRVCAWIRWRRREKEVGNVEDEVVVNEAEEEWPSLGLDQMEKVEEKKSCGEC